MAAIDSGAAAVSAGTSQNPWAERREDYALRYVPSGYRHWGPPH